MSRRPIVLDSDLKRLQEEGYEVEVRSGHVLVHSIPYVNARREIARGIVVTNLGGNVGGLGAPGDHQVWFVGDYPCHHTGAPIDGIRNSSENRELWPGFAVQHRFSNKPFGASGYPDYYSKLTNYISIIANEAKLIDPNATPCTFTVVESTEEDSVFRYWDSASSRSNTLSVSARLSIGRIAIIGLGGTGSYVLDLIAKTPVREIHLFDGDVFCQHNAFRSPGAASADVLEEALPKVDYFSRIYGAMRTGVIAHPVHVTEDNLKGLEGFDFAFLCVDKGAVRRLVGSFLKQQNIPFVDVGMELMHIPEENSLFGTCRITCCTPEKSDHFERHAPLGADDANDLYRSNIQVADMNCLNAAFAVIKWKQYCGFYQDLVKVHHSTFSINAHSLTRGEMIGSCGDTE